MKIRVTLEPNQESDIQSVLLSDLGLTKEEALAMDKDELDTLLWEQIHDNINGVITTHEFVD